MNLFPSSGEGGGKTRTQLGPLGVGIFPPSPEGGNRFTLRNVVFSIFQNTGR
jgi:hypothetical protein